MVVSRQILQAPTLKRVVVDAHEPVVVVAFVPAPFLFCVHVRHQSVAHFRVERLGEVPAGGLAPRRAWAN